MTGDGKTGQKNTSGRGQRELRVRVKTAKGRKLSSTLWLERQLNDPYVMRARKEGYRGRAAYKILELDDKFGFLKPGARVVDLGCAPGGWCQVAVARVNALGERPNKPVGTVLGVDLQEVVPISGAVIHRLDFLEDGADDKVKAWLGGPADVVLSDMAAAASGHRQTDHLRIVALCEAAAQFAFDVLEKGGTFVAKVLAGGAETALQTTLKRNFTKVANVKPPASRPDSSEKFVVAMGFKGRSGAEPAGTLKHE
ncbi:MAG: RlmE family RNA methyltransferase [Rhodobacter sp.]|nr:RlmE family RNA methyltransferase [Rhodobacter sp.]